VFVLKFVLCKFIGGIELMTLLLMTISAGKLKHCLCLK